MSSLPAETVPLTADVYRQAVASDDLVAARVRARQTDMLVSGMTDLGERALALVHRYRRDIEGYIRVNPRFAESLVPLAPDTSAPAVVAAMLDAGVLANVGPMAAVAGAIAECVGRDLLPFSRQVIVENGGDVFVRSTTPREVALLAESSDFEGLRVALPGSSAPVGIGTSSGTRGPSLSFGRADAVMAVAPSAAFADAAATAIANVVCGAGDLEGGLARARDLGVDGVLIVADGRMAAWGRIELAG